MGVSEDVSKEASSFEICSVMKINGTEADKSLSTVKTKHNSAYTEKCTNPFFVPEAGSADFTATSCHLGRGINRLLLLLLMLLVAANKVRTRVRSSTGSTAGSSSGVGATRSGGDGKRDGGNSREGYGEARSKSR